MKKTKLLYYSAQQLNDITNMPECGYNNYAELIESDINEFCEKNKYCEFGEIQMINTKDNDMIVMLQYEKRE